jgi:transcriptional regulator with XRE-family HTH domain
MRAKPTRKATVKNPKPAKQGDLGRAIRHAREQAGMTLKDLAEKIHTAFTLVSQYELGQANPPAWRVQAIARATRRSFRVDARGWKDEEA